MWASSEEAAQFVDEAKDDLGLSAHSPLKNKAVDARGGATKKDIGADMEALRKATRGAVSGVWTAERK